MLRLHAFLAFLLTMSSCFDKNEVTGTIRVESKATGQYEIYKVSENDERQYFAELSGSFNADVKVQPGNYVLMSDCSSMAVVVKPQSVSRVKMHRVYFQTQFPPSERSKFTVECRKTRDMRFRQKIENRFYLDLLEGQTEVLVGMQPLNFDFSNDKVTEPAEVKVPLSSIIVRSIRATPNTSEYFVSKMQESISLTQSQIFGETIYLMPGDYKVELNGTKKSVNLDHLDHMELEVGYFTIETGKKVNVSSSLEIRGRPLNAVVNNDHAVSLNETFPALPGDVTLRLVGSDKEHTIGVVAGVEERLNVRSVTVDSSCSAWYWECLGRRKVYLYEKDKTYAFAEGVTDVPIIFIGSDAWVGLEGSYDVRYKLPTKKRDMHLNLGSVTIKPRPMVSKRYVTDLVRIETSGGRFFGQTLDIDLLQQSRFPLVPGYYVAAGYSTLIGRSHKRTSHKRGFVVKKGDNVTIEVPVYLSKTRYHRFLGKRKRLERQRIEAAERRWKSAYRPGKRLPYQ